MGLRICLVALNAYPAIDSVVPGIFGGIETRAWSFARGLAARHDCDVTFVVRHWQELRQAEYDGVNLKLLRDRLYPFRESLAARLKRSRNFPWITLAKPRLSDALFLPFFMLRKALSRRRDPRAAEPLIEQIDADVFITFGVQSTSATVISSAKETGRPCVLWLGSDGDLDERYLNPTDFVSVYHDSATVCRWIIDQADDILCQTPAQQARLSLFGRTATCIPNPIDLAQWDRLLAEPVPQDIAILPRSVLWIGRAENVHKCPDQCVELARRLPGIPFVMVLNPRDAEVEAEIRRAAPSNLTIIDRVPFSQIPNLMKRSAMLVNTSSLEGFPNTFLQAVASGIPIVSLNVEQEFLERSKAGLCSYGNLERMEQQVCHFWQGHRGEQDATFARDYIEQNHSLTALVDQLVQHLHVVLRTREPQ